MKKDNFDIFRSMEVHEENMELRKNTWSGGRICLFRVRHLTIGLKIQQHVDLWAPLQFVL